MAALKKISLLPREGFENTPLGRVLTWALSAGRTIVIITELIVILAFLSRFWFDRTLTDLNDQIKEKANFVQAQKSFEAQFRNVQARIVQARETKQEITKLAEIIISKVPPSARLDKVAIEDNQTQITGLALSEGAIELFTRELERADIGKVALTQLSSNPQGGLKFGIEIKQVKEEGENKK